MELDVPGQIDGIDPAVESIMTELRRCGTLDGKEFEVQTALYEALVNAVKHGCKERPGSSVQVRVHSDKKRGILITVRDPGDGFDPLTVPSPVIGRNICSTHGRGIYLINRLMDEVHHEKGGTVIHMRALPSSPEPV